MKTSPACGGSDGRVLEFGEGASSGSVRGEGRRKSVCDQMPLPSALHAPLYSYHARSRSIFPSSRRSFACTRSRDVKEVRPKPGLVADKLFSPMTCHSGEVRRCVESRLGCLSPNISRDEINRAFTSPSIRTHPVNMIDPIHCEIHCAARPAGSSCDSPSRQGRQPRHRPRVAEETGRECGTG